jgi:hypothetical protein
MDEGLRREVEEAGVDVSVVGEVNGRGGRAGVEEDGAR